MTHTTLLLLVRGDPIERVLLGFKKTGFGKGKYTGIGGKVEHGETLVEATVREMAEETGVIVSTTDLVPAGRIAFYFPARPAWNLFVHVFLTWRWRGQPEERREVRPEWFAVAAMPFDAMWDDAAYWYPHVLSGKTLDATFTFKADNETVDTYTFNASD